jgi:outer membrane protein assembly factor BamB
VVLGHRLFVGSTVNDSLTAYDTRTGNELWRFYTEGPVRFAPVAANGKVYAVSDDGHLYCLEAETGTLRWKMNGGPAKRLIVGNDRLVSTWPARGGVVLAEGVLYFTASIWPSMGVFIHAVDAESGKILWTNSDTGSRYVVHPHGAPSFGSIVPQGYLAVAGDYLVVPGGRSLPGVFHRKTGELVHFDFGGKTSGGFHVMAGDESYWVGGELFQLKDGLRLASMKADLMTPQECIAFDGQQLQLLSLKGGVQTKTVTDRKGQPQEVATFTPKEKRSLPLGSGLSGEIYCAAGNRIYLGGKNKIAAVDVPRAHSDQPLSAAWRMSIDDIPSAMLAADDRLFVVTENHKLYCYGAGVQPANVHSLPEKALPAANDAWAQNAKPFIEASRSKGGYALALGIGSGRLIEELLQHTELHIVAVDSDRAKLNHLRQKLDQAGLYGTRLAAIEGDPTNISFPPYFADLIVVEDEAAAPTFARPGPLAHIFQALRPYGGVFVFSTTEGQHATVQAMVDQQAETFAGVKLERQGSLTRLRRAGALPNSADWTHQYGDATNSAVSKDQLVKAPLGVLWFGGPSNDKVLPRHGHGPSPQVAGGRLVIEGPDMLRAVDVYTGRVHWEKDLPGVGEYYNVTRHFSGAGEVGSNYVTLSDRVYVIYQNKILELDAVDGETVHAYELDAEENEKKTPTWGFLAAAGNKLVATTSPVKVPGTTTPKATNTATISQGYSAIIKPHAEWSYLAGSDPKADWTSPDYTAKNWKQGIAGFGFGDDDDRTILNDMQGKYTRVYIRKELDGSDLKNRRDVALAINYDDGFIAYWNGEEIASAHVGKGRGPEASNISSHEAKGYETFPLPDVHKLFKPGKNVLAIEGHNVGLTSSDFSLDPYLVTKSSETQLASDGEKSNNAPATKRLDDLLQSADKASSSRRLVVYDAKTRQELWHREAVYSFRHNSIVATEDRVYCMDSLSPDQFQQLKRRGLNVSDQARLLALDAQTGHEIWSTTENVFGTFLNYSADHDVLLQAGSRYSDRAADEVGTGMIAYRGSTGEVLWHDLKLSYGGPCLLWRDKIITNGRGGFQLGLFDGEKTGWEYSRMYGCNTAVGSEHLLTFRSGAAGFCDLSGDSGTGNLGGFKSSCTSNLIVANGVLNAPDYTRTCNCAYQNQTSVAWIHMPDADSWTFSTLSSADNLERMGWNLGAPGDRRSEEGTLWFDYPSQGGPSPKLEVSVEPANVKWFSQHASTVAGESSWITASGTEGVRTLTLAVPEALRNHKSLTVRLYFAERDSIQEKDRVFSIKLQDEVVTAECDIVQEAGGIRTTLLKEYPGIKPSRKLTVTLTPVKGSSLEPILCGVEIVPHGGVTPNATGK